MNALPRIQVFGSALRTNILVLTRLLENTYTSELAKLLNISQPATYKAVRRLEDQDILAIRTVGVQRVISLNPRFFGASELAALLSKLAQLSPEYQKRAAQLRRRPRKTGKRLWR